MTRYVSTLLTLILLLMGAISVSAQGSCSEAADCETRQTQADSSTDDTESIDFLTPELERLPVDNDLLHDRWYQQVSGTVPVYDAPDGNVVRTIDIGFNFVTALEENNGWTRINIDEWVRSDTLNSMNWTVSEFSGVLLPDDGLPYTMAWALVNMYPSPEPGADPSEEFDYIPRYTELYIHDTEIVDGHRWYLIADGQWVHQFNVAKILPVENKPDDVTTDLWFSIDLYEQVVIAYDDTTPVFATLVSTGLPRWPTYEGTFNIYFRRTRDFMSWGTVGDDFYSLEEVPWTMFFDEGRALHGAYWHDGFGYRRSHGCVNMTITDAKWMYDLVADYMDKRISADREEGPNVYVYSSDEYND
jgi:hypothetical protein